MCFETQLKMSLVQILNFLSWSAIISQIISCKKGERLPNLTPSILNDLNLQKGYKGYKCNFSLPYQYIKQHASDKKGQNLSARACLQADIVQIPSISL